MDHRIRQLDDLQFLVCLTWPFAHFCSYTVINLIPTRHQVDDDGWMVMAVASAYWLYYVVFLACQSQDGSIAA